ncbi:MAG TPA: HD-GYP domain-containing protein [Gemmataceae bacterium]|nr:HD-GYP domain-containing protein [Gemmataceae bacterium]
MLSFISKNLASSTLAPHRGHDAAWELMDRLMQDLDSCERANEQIHLTLEAVRQGLAANVVFWFDIREEKLQAAADTKLPDGWAHAVMAAAAAQSQPTDGQAVRNLEPRPAPGVNPWPHSLALVPLNRSRKIWIGAGRFQPGHPFRSADLRILSLARRMLHNQRRQALTHGKLKETLIGFVRCMTATIDAKDHTTGGHSERVARMAVRLGKQLAVPETVLGDIYLAGILHDIGKIGIQDSVLQKPDKLTVEEFEHLKQHVIIGDRIISNLKPFNHLRPGVRNHHERWDGKGYPDGLSGSATPLLARLLAVADSCDAMLSPRPYRAAMPITKMEAILLQGAGSQWDPTIVDHFMECRDDLYSICFEGSGETIAIAVERAALVTDSTLSVPGGMGM